MRIYTYERNSWTGSNTEAFKTWAAPFLVTPPPGYSWVWDTIDNENDPLNVIEDGFLRARVPGIGYGSYNLLFALDEAAIAGPLVDGEPNQFIGMQVSAMPVAQADAMYEEIV